MNTVKKEETYRAVNIDISPRRIEFIDADEFEDEIRADEARKWIEKDIRRHQREKERREKKAAKFMYKLVMRMIGSIIITGSYIACKYVPEGGAGLLPLVFIAIVMIIAPTPDDNDI